MGEKYFLVDIAYSDIYYYFEIVIWIKYTYNYFIFIIGVWFGNVNKSAVEIYPKFLKLL